MADIAKGTDVKWGATSVSGIVSFAGPSISADPVDATDLGDTAKPFLHPGIYDPGEVTLELNYDPDVAIHDQMLTDFAAGTKRVLLFEWQNGTAATADWSSYAYISALNPGAAQGDKLAASATFKLTDAITL